MDAVSGTPELIALALCGLLAGIGISAIGPGGVLATIALFALSTLSPDAVAGTAIVTHIGTGALGAAVYARSGHLLAPLARRNALILCGAAVLGTPLGIWLNSLVSSQAFGVLLGLFSALVALLVWRRQRGGGGPAEHHPRHPLALLACLGFGVAAVGGLFGIGGPMLAVPLLVALGVPMLPALAAAQAQSIVIAGIGALGYLAQGSIDWPLAALIGLPELCGVAIGWRLARSLATPRLTRALVVVLLALAPYLALHG